MAWHLRQGSKGAGGAGVASSHAGGSPIPLPRYHHILGGGASGTKVRSNSPGQPRGATAGWVCRTADSGVAPNWKQRQQCSRMQQWDESFVQGGPEGRIPPSSDRRALGSPGPLVKVTNHSGDLPRAHLYDEWRAMQFGYLRNPLRQHAQNPRRRLARRSVSSKSEKRTQTETDPHAWPLPRRSHARKDSQWKSGPPRIATCTGYLGGAPIR